MVLLPALCWGIELGLQLAGLLSSPLSHLQTIFMGSFGFHRENGCLGLSVRKWISKDLKPEQIP